MRSSNKIYTCTQSNIKALLKQENLHAGGKKQIFLTWIMDANFPPVMFGQSSLKLYLDNKARYSNMTTGLSGKKILFITTQFYGYEKAIIRSLKDQGAELNVYYDDPVSYTRIKFLKSAIRRRTRSFVNRHYRAYILRKTARRKFDYIFFLKGSIMSEPFLKALRSAHPGALLIQYQWDSLANFNNAHLIHCFDVSYTFDKADAERVPSLTYMPTFALDEFFDIRNKKRSTKKDLDVSFVGSNHSDRLQILRNLRRRLKNAGFAYRFYLYLPVMVSLKSVLITRKMKPDEFTIGPLSRSKYKKLLLRSRYVLDLPSPKQTGISLRTYEALASGCGLITTSKTISEEPFFDEKHIFVIEPDFLNESITALLQREYSPDLLLSFDEYSLSSWVKKIFSFEKEDAEDII